jgi:hypothetical protein
MRDERLQAEAERISTPNYLKSKSDIVEHYRDTYGKDWRKQYTADTIKAEGLPNTAKTRNTISRRVQGDRADKPAKQGSTKASFEKLGTALPPTSRTPKQDTITISVRAKEDSHGRTKDRTITVTMSGTQAYDFVNAPDYDDIWDEYGVDADTFDEYLEVTGVSIS